MKIMNGKCLCESIEYEISGSLGPIYNCHCSKCRRWHGSAFRTRASIDKSQFKWLKGSDNLSAYKSSENVTKFFCKTCGSPLISTYENKPDVLGIPLGGIEGISTLTQRHIFLLPPKQAGTKSRIPFSSMRHGQVVRRRLEKQVYRHTLSLLQSGAGYLVLE